MSEKDKKVVVFVDSLGNDDLEHMDFVREELATGEMDAGPVFVTPVVLGSIYTGTSPTNHGLPSVSRHDQDNRLRPADLTIPEFAALSETYENVAQLWYPFIVPVNIQANGRYWHHSEAMGTVAMAPQESAAAMSVPSPAGQIDKPDENHDLAFNLRVDHAMTAFGTARNLLEMWEVDLMFIGYRVTDAYCHYQYDQPDDGGPTYRERLLEQVDREIRYLANQAEVFVFGDHGARSLTEVFRLNRWLIDRGYLDVDIDHEWREKAIEYGVLEVDDDQPGDIISIADAAVTLNESESVAVSADPFSGGITLLEGATEGAVDRLIDELGRESAIDEVAWTTDLYGPGELQAECPDLYAVRAPGAFVSGNLAEEPGGAEVTRSGVHHHIGAFGTTADVDLPDERITPEELFSAIAHGFLELDTADLEEQAGAGDPMPVETDERDVREHLADLGYL